ncbi:hypothetical protein Paz_07 [Xylella phage Paz]|uniref:Uncharacterized protein n=1 Tax=Xylella phage Paz TaxID=1415145 RepID=V5Q7K7_9CAUD|nr:hypothetical protein Paz_07 [Xylella phage Paz]AHB12104.1 hypothetical protein Paz_07 [Xylella phage Paz]
MSNTTANRKQYVIAYGIDDILHHNGVNSEPVRLLPEGLKKFIDAINSADLRRMLSPADQASRTEVTKAWSQQQYLLVTRRAAARRIVQILKAAGYHCRDDFRLIEVGSTPREVKPVKHWNIERRYRYVYLIGGRKEPWSDPETWDRGIATRANAREQAELRTRETNARSEDYEYKFTAVPVYA